MKSATILALLATPLLAHSPAARADDPVANGLVPVSVHAIFVPGGFDDNDESQVILDGYLPSTCYRLSHNTAALDAATGAIKVVQYARKFAEPCLPMRVPFTSEVRLGVLPHAAFKVNVQGAAEANLTVTEALNGGPDDYLYAPVESAQVAYDSAAGNYVATISGRLTNSCLEWGEVKVLDQGKVLVIQPILTMRDEQGCIATETPFERKVVLPGRLADGRHLLHVRSLNGKAVNAMFSVGRF